MIRGAATGWPGRRALVLGAQLVALAAVLGCSKKGGDKAEPAAARAASSDKPAGRVVVALSVDWEGAYLDPEGLGALEGIQEELGDAPLTHFICPAYFTRPGAESGADQTIREMIREGDEVALHLHMWKSLVEASGVAMRSGPSFLEDELMAFGDGDVGFEVRLDAYEPDEIAAILAHSLSLLESAGLTPSKSFRAGGVIGTPKTFKALVSAGFKVDSSGAPARWHTESVGHFSALLKENWPSLTPGTPPYRIEGVGGNLVEVPISGGGVEYASTEEMLGHLREAGARLKMNPESDVFVGFAFHQETAAEYAPQVLAVIRGARELLGEDLLFVTVAEAAARAFPELASAAPAR